MKRTALVATAALALALGACKPNRTSSAPGSPTDTGFGSGASITDTSGTVSAKNGQTSLPPTQTSTGVVNTTAAGGTTGGGASGGTGGTGATGTAGTAGTTTTH